MSISIGPDIVIGRRGISLSGGGAAAPWWLSGGISAANAIAVYQPIGAASLAASYVNLANPGTYDAAPGVAPTFDAATGWTFNGSTQYLATGVAVTNGAVVARMTPTTFTGTHSAVGALDLGVAGRIELLPVFNTNRGYSNGVLLTIAGNITTNAVIAVSGAVAYQNGVPETGSVGGTGTETQLFIGARNRGASADSFFAGKIQAVAIYNATLTADQVAAVSTAMAAL